MRTAYEIAKSYLGLAEWPGARHNPQVVGFFEQSGHGWVEDDETPWCAAFVGAVLAQAGMRGTGKLNAQSYKDWGEEVSLEDAQRGDIVVFWRESPNSWKGHVGFYEGQRHDTIMVLGGNQGNKVSIAEYPEARLLSVRRAKPKREKPSQTRTVQATAAQAGSAIAAGATAVSQFEGTAQLVVIGSVALIVLLALWIMRDRIRKFAEGDQ